MIAEADDKANPGVGGAPVSSIVEDQKAPHVAGAPVEAAPRTSELAGLPFLELPYDRPRAAMPGFRPANEPFTLPQGLSDSLRALGRRENTTLDAVLLAAFHALLFRYTGQEDIAIGASTDGPDPSPEGKTEGGPNTAIIRADLSGDPVFLELTQRVLDIATQAQASPEEERSARMPNKENGNGTMPLLQVFFSIKAGTRLSKPSNGQGYAGAVFSGSVDRLATFDLYLSFEDCPGGIRGRINTTRRCLRLLPSAEWWATLKPSSKALPPTRKSICRSCRS